MPEEKSELRKRLDELRSIIDEADHTRSVRGLEFLERLEALIDAKIARNPNDLGLARADLMKSISDALP